MQERALVSSRLHVTHHLRCAGLPHPSRRRELSRMDDRFSDTIPDIPPSPHAAHSRGGDDGDFDRLVAQELFPLTESEQARMVGQRWLERPPRNLFGIALSGGGIRSATFNLGLLQGLNEVGMLRGMDYLGTVSGGGYTGGFWTRWLAKGARGGGASGPVFPQLQTSGLNASHVDASLRLGDEPAELRHLRKFSRFLAPDVGVFTFDTGRMLVTLVNAVVPSLLGAAAFLISVVVGTLLIGAWVLMLPGVIALGVPAFGTHGAIHIGAFLTMFGFGAAHLVVMEKLWKDEPSRWRTRGLAALLQLGLLALLWGALFAWMADRSSAVLTADFWTGAVRGLIAGNGTRHPISLVVWIPFLMPTLAFIGVSVVIALFRSPSGARAQSWRYDMRSEADRVSSWLSFAAIAWIVVVALWAIAVYLHVTFGMRRSLGAVGASGLPVAGLVTFLTRFITRPSPGGERPLQILARFSLATLAWLVLAACVVLAMLGLMLAAQDGTSLGVMLGVTALIMAYTWWLHDTNQVGFHHFYRERITRAYLGAATLRGTSSDDASDPQPGDDLPLPEMDVSHPVHLVVCAANSLRPANPLTDLSRGAESAVLSPVGFSVGSSWTTWRSEPTSAERRGKDRYRDVPTLGAALTASAAAFNTQMGAKSKALGPAVSFLTTMFGLRLGLWLRHPERLTNGSPVVRGRVGGSFFRELLGQSDARNDDWVFLSDGGHFDNTALYELVRRHCRFIIVSDCGEDADRAFDDLGAAVRRIRADFDVDIRVNLEPLKPDAAGCSRQPMVAGDIHYPDGDTGTILVFKPTIVGTEPPDILQYRARNSKFPHQSTTDQFFDEAQWESYRRLGQHAARIAFTTSIERSRHPSLSTAQQPLTQLTHLTVLRERMAGEFSAARREWFARPTNYGERVETIAQKVVQLDALMAESGPRIIKDVSWELGGAQTPVAGTPLAVMTLEESAQAISTIHRALAICESIFLSENFATQSNQPMYVGVMNLMARWMQAPMLRTWWPLMRATCTEGFRQFAESHFGLGTVKADLIMPASLDGDVLALATRTTEQSGAPRVNAPLRLVLQLDDVQGAAGAPLPRARIEVARLDANVADDTTVMVWLARDLLVPPGLWGMGLGSGLLARLRSGGADRSGSPDALLATKRVQIVFVRTFRAGSAGAKKDSADFQQFYTQAGFEPITPRQLAEAHPIAFPSAYEKLYTRCASTEPYLPPPMELVTLTDTPDFVTLWRPVTSPA